MPFQSDPDWKYFDEVVALALQVNSAANRIKEISDDPKVLMEALVCESGALVIQKLHVDYRPRVARLKKIEMARGNGPIKG